MSNVYDQIIAEMKVVALDGAEYHLWLDKLVDYYGDKIHAEDLPERLYEIVKKHKILI